VTPFTVQELWRFLRESAGGPDGDGPVEELTDTTFTDLGYDSLALLEVSARVSREYAVTLPDSIVFDCTTPNEFAAAVNRIRREAAA
jgi:act minimal PKS acyl carrier protein